MALSLPRRGHQRAGSAGGAAGSRRHEPLTTFEDRYAAGRQLAVRLAPLAAEAPVVVAVPRGGVPVGYEVARALDAPLDLLAVRKLGATGQPELAVGAMAEENVGVVDPELAALTGTAHDDLERLVRRESAELRRRVRAYRGDRPALALAGRTVIVVDDGLATGLSDLAAVRAVQRRGAARVIVAAPVGSAEAVSRLRDEADDVVCLCVPPALGAVGRWYTDFSAVLDAEVVALLAASRRPQPAPAGA